MAKKTIRPKMVFADEQGNIYDHPELEMLCRRGDELARPRPDELIPLPQGSDIFQLPSRSALGLDASTGNVEAGEGYAVAGFVCPGYTLSGLSAYETLPSAPRLPLFAYGAVGFANNRFYVCAKKVDADKRQDFSSIKEKRIQSGVSDWLKEYPDNRLVRHLSRCALTYCCPAAKNLALGRYEAPLPTSRACNARCIGCISLQRQDSGFPATQNRISFSPTPKEITEIMARHGRFEKRPIFSFGQGCEGEPLTNAGLIGESIGLFRKMGGEGTVNINTNGSFPGEIPSLASKGLSSVRVSLNSGLKTNYTSYYRPKGYSFQDVMDFLNEAGRQDLFISLNLLFFPGITDTEEELAALCEILHNYHVNLIQMRNLNLDPELYLQIMPAPGPSMGLNNFMRRIRKTCPWIQFGYFNPYVEK